MRNAILALAAAASLSLVAKASSAQPPAAPAPAAPSPAQPTPDQARADAHKRLNEGLDRYGRGDYDGARIAFQQAYSVLASVDLLYNLARAEVKSGHALEALVHIRQILRDPKATPDDHTKAARLFDEANRVTAHVAIEAPAGAEIVIDHVPSGEAPVNEPFDVTPGKHVCEARANGTTRVIEVTASVGDVVTARFALDAARAPTVSAPVPVAAPPAAVAQQPADTNEPPPEHVAPHHHESNARVVVPLVIGAAAVVAVGVGVGLGLVSKGKESDAEDFRASHAPGFCANSTSSACTQYANILDSQQQATSVERALLIGGGVLAVGAVVTYLVWPHRSHSERDAMWIAPAPGGVGFGGTF